MVYMYGIHQKKAGLKILDFLWAFLSLSEKKKKWFQSPCSALGKWVVPSSHVESSHQEFILSIKTSRRPCTIEKSKEDDIKPVLKKGMTLLFRKPKLNS